MHYSNGLMTMTPYLELGLDTFGDVTRDADGRPLPQAQVIRNVIDEAALADELGIDFIGVGEHHRPDFAVSAPEVVLAAIAGRTSRIKLGSAVTQRICFCLSLIGMNLANEVARRLIRVELPGARGCLGYTRR